MLNIVLYEPEIPANTGTIGRSCVLTDSRLHLIEPLGFSLDDRMIRRAGMGYWHDLDVTTYPSWEAFTSARPGARLWFLSARAARSYALPVWKCFSFFSRYGWAFFSALYARKERMQGILF